MVELFIGHGAYVNLGQRDNGWYGALCHLRGWWEWEWE